MANQKELRSSQAVMLGVLVLKTLERVGIGMPVTGEDNTVSIYRSARVGNVMLLEKPSDAQSPRWIDCYRVEDVESFKLDPARVLFSIEFLHNAKPRGVVKLRSGCDPALWFGRVLIALLTELCKHDPRTRDNLRDVVRDYVVDRTPKHLDAS